MKFKLFELEDKKWLPGFIREGMTDYLRFIFNLGNLYEPVIPILHNLLQQVNLSQVIDLCSGGGGNIQKIQQGLKLHFDADIHFTLTDKFPNIKAYQQIKEASAGSIQYSLMPVDASNAGDALKGVRTIFSAFHHFDEKLAQRVLQDAVSKKQAIAIFDGGGNKVILVLAIILLHPIAFVLCTPFIKPFNFRRIVFTYILPIIPLCTIWDGIVSVSKLYTPEQMLQIANAADDKTYCWQAGKKTNKFGMGINFLYGYPLN